MIIKIEKGSAVTYAENIPGAALDGSALHVGIGYGRVVALREDEGLVSVRVLIEKSAMPSLVGTEITFSFDATATRLTAQDEAESALMAA